MGHDSLVNYFQTNFSLVQHHHWSLSEMESMIPWERYVYIDLLQSFLKEQEQRAKDRENEIKTQMSIANRRRM
jgi:hypothetical protein